MTETHYDCPCLERCPLHYAMDVIGGKWKMQIICALNNAGTLRYNALRKKLGGVSNTVLASALRELERDGLVIRREYLEVPVRVEYAPTPACDRLMPILEQLSDWGEAQMAGESITTQRLIITPYTDEELAGLIENELDPHMKQAYREILELSKSKPSQRVWCTEWRIALKTGETIGGAGFKGPAVDGAVEIGYGIDEAYRERGYATEASLALIEWAFSHPEVARVEVESEADNAASLKVIEKLGFTLAGQGEEGPRFSLTRRL